MERIDKIISSQLSITRAQAKELVKSKKVLLNGVMVKSANDKADMEKDSLAVNGKEISYKKYVYIMMNKPKGVISSTDGRKTKEKTVIDILPEDMKRKNLFPAGRLDKDTTGFMLITDDGAFAHSILSPKKHIPKTYIAVLDKPFDKSVINAFEAGVELKDEVCMPAELYPLNGDFCIAVVTIKQGKYHQIKRMFAKFGLAVVDLKRIKMGNLCLDESLEEGQCRYLEPSEIESIKD